MKKVIFLLALPLFALMPHFAHAASCSFTRDLDSSVQGEDVRCLQKYLNGAGYVISASGVGSPGNETSLFREGTKAAVKKWQAANGLSASGMFGPLSRAKYATLANGSSATASGNSSLATQIASLLARLNDLKAQVAAKNGTATTPTSATQSSAKSAISAAQDAVDAAEAAVEDFDGDTTDYDSDVSRGKSMLKDAQDYYDEKDYANALSYANRATKYAGQVTDDLDSGDRASSDKALSAAKSAIRDAEDAIDAATGDTGDAESNLKDAKDNYNRAKGYYDDNKFDRALTYAKKSKQNAADAVDAAGSEGKSGAYSALKKSQHAIDDAQEIINAAKTDYVVGDAADSMSKATAAQTKAKGYYDDADYSRANTYAGKAIGYARDALDQGTIDDYMHTEHISWDY